MRSDVFQIDNVAMKIIIFEAIGDFMCQHVHKFEHKHYVLDGVVALIVDGVETEYGVNDVISLPAHKAHKLIAKTEHARSMCCHILTPDEMGNFEFNSVIV